MKHRALIYTCVVLVALVVFAALGAMAWGVWIVAGLVPHPWTLAARLIAGGCILVIALQVLLSCIGLVSAAWHAKEL